MVEHIANFLGRYRVFSDELHRTQLEQLTSGFARIRSQLLRLRAEEDERNRLTADSFNIFRLLGVAYAEVGTHSALLRDLLDPEGTHAQKHLFLQGFLKTAGDGAAGFPLPIGDVTSAQWVVQREKVTPWGTMDLVLSCRSLGYLLVIENKITASEQPEQLQRYYAWMESRRHEYPDQALVYLTPGGDPASTSAGCPYYALSYRCDIRQWLTTALPRIQAPKVKVTITQYLEVISTL